METSLRAPISCSQCGTGPLVFVSPGEAKGLRARTKILCPTCATSGAVLTARESEMIEVARRLRSMSGATPTYADIGEVTGLTASRHASIAQRIREKGFGDRLSDARFGTSLETPEPEALDAVGSAEMDRPFHEPTPVDYFEVEVGA